jgi:transposase
MMCFTGALKIYLAIEPQDMRKSFNGLYAAAEHELGEDPRKGALFVFCNKRRNRIKTLYFDGTGVWISAKRLEAGTFSWPKPSGPNQKKLKLVPEALQLLLDGVDLRGAQLRPWYEDGKVA